MAEVTITGTIKNAIRNIPFVNEFVDLALVEVFESGDIGYLTEQSTYKIDDSGGINGTGIDIIVSDDEPASYSINLPSALVQGQGTVEILEIEDSPSTQKVEDLIYGGTAPDGGTIVISGELRNPLNDLPYANAFATIALQQLFTTQDGVYPPTSALVKVSQGLFNGENGLTIYVPEGEPSLWSFIFPDGTVVSAKFDSSMAEVNIADVLDGDYVEWVAPSDLDPVTNLELEITGANYDEITVTASHVTGATEYDIEYSPDGVTYTPVDTTPLLTYDITDSDYDVDVAIHYVRVRASNGSVDSEWAYKSIYGHLINTPVLWTMDETSGNALDSIGSNTLVDNNTVGTITGKLNGARQFISANDEYFEIASNSDVGVGDEDFTFAFWLYRASGMGGGEVPIGKWDGAGAGPYILLQPSGSIRFQLHGTSGDIIQNSTQLITFDAWNLIVLKHNAATNQMGIKINGNAIEMQATGAPLDGITSQPLDVGKWGGGQNFNGNIDQFLICKRVWSTTQDNVYWNSSNGLSYAQLIAGI